MRVAPQAKLADGKLDVCRIHKLNPFKLFCMFPTVYFGKHLWMPEVEYWKADRVCLTTDPKLRMPIQKPAGYREIDHELLLRNFDAGDERLPALIEPLAGGKKKVDWNNMHAVGSDHPGGNWDYPEAGYERRREIEQEHVHPWLAEEAELPAFGVAFHEGPQGRLIQASRPRHARP